MLFSISIDLLCLVYLTVKLLIKQVAIKLKYRSVRENVLPFDKFKTISFVFDC